MWMEPPVRKVLPVQHQPFPVPPAPQVLALPAPQGHKDFREILVRKGLRACKVPPATRAPQVLVLREFKE